jgi:hypothetical protein
MIGPATTDGPCRVFARNGMPAVVGNEDIADGAGILIAAPALIRRKPRGVCSRNPARCRVIDLLPGHSPIAVETPHDPLQIFGNSRAEAFVCHPDEAVRVEIGSSVSRNVAIRFLREGEAASEPRASARREARPPESPWPGSARGWSSPAVSRRVGSRPLGGSEFFRPTCGVSTAIAE